MNWATPATAPVDGCRLGYGLSQVKEAIWVCLPFVDRAKGQHALHCGAMQTATASYCLEVVEIVCQHWGATAIDWFCVASAEGLSQPSYIGLRNDQIASLWCGLMAHSHFDGVKTGLIPDCDAQSARERGKNDFEQTQWISHD